mmetsp:Transcript_5409/g.7206  ORF Transcript_5409/g.7206 Transcript_5409/m.7206 type:complete len:401 (-) Transcript_5409:19-1221(-)
MLAACRSEAMARLASGRSQLADHVIVCRERESLGDNTFRVFQTSFFENLLGGASVATSFKLAKHKLRRMASDIEEEVQTKLNNRFITPQDRARVSMLKEQASELNKVENFLLLPEGGDHDVSFSFKAYSPPPPKLKTWIPACPEWFNPSPFQMQLIWAVGNYLQLQRNLFSALQYHEDSSRGESNNHRWVQMTGPRKSGRSSIAKYIAWRLGLYDEEGPDGIFWVEGGKSRADVMQRFVEALPEQDCSRLRESRLSDDFARLKRFMTLNADRPMLLIIDDVDDVKDDDREKLFKDLMSLGTRLHILTMSERPILVRELHSNSEKLDLAKILPKLLFKKIFKQSAHSLKCQRFTGQMSQLKPYHFSKLWGRCHFAGPTVCVVYSFSFTFKSHVVWLTESES